MERAGNTDDSDSAGEADDDVPDAIAAATVILGRDHPAGPELLMVRRDANLAFAGGMWVFPGGRLDADDFAGDLDDLSAAETRAAVREASEEAGLSVDPSSLVRLSHWTPAQRPLARRFSTAFFAAPAPQGKVRIDDAEIRDHRWVSATDALAMHASGAIELAPPTFVTLNVISALSSVERLLAFARHGPIEHFRTRVAVADEAVYLLYHGDAGYEAGDPHRAGGRHRIHYHLSPWRYERDVGPADEDLWRP